MKLPTKITMRPTMFTDGARGMAIQTSRNNEFGVTCEAMRKDRASRFVERWLADALPGRDFPSYGALWAAMDEARLDKAEGT